MKVTQPATPNMIAKIIMRPVVSIPGLGGEETLGLGEAVNDGSSMLMGAILMVQKKKKKRQRRSSILQTQSGK